MTKRKQQMKEKRGEKEKNDADTTPRNYPTFGCFTDCFLLFFCVTSPSFVFLRFRFPLYLARSPFFFFLRLRKSPFSASLSLSCSVRPIPRIIPGCGVECGRPSFASSSVQPMSPASVILRRSFACAPQGLVKLTWNTRPRRPPRSLLSLSSSLPQIR